MYNQDYKNQDYKYDSIKEVAELKLKVVKNRINNYFFASESDKGLQESNNDSLEEYKKLKLKHAKNRVDSYFDYIDEREEPLQENVDIEAELNEDNDYFEEYNKAKLQSIKNKEHNLFYPDETEEYLQEESKIYLESCLPKQKTGLPANIWLGHTKSGDSDLPHNIPRVKFQMNKQNSNTGRSDLCPISISENPEVLLKEFQGKSRIGGLRASEVNEIKDFIKKYKDVFLDYWNENISEAEAKNIILNDIKNKGV